MPAGTWIVNALLTPFLWGLGLLILAWLGDVWPPLRPRVSRLFDWLERPPAESPNEPAISHTVVRAPVSSAGHAVAS